MRTCAMTRAYRAGARWKAVWTRPPLQFRHVCADKASAHKLRPWMSAEGQRGVRCAKPPHHKGAVDDMHDALSIIFASRARLTVALALVAAVIAGGVTFGSWAVGSDPGNGYAKATTATNLTFNDVSASTTATLYPGGNGSVKVSVNNPNPFAVTITAVNGTGGAITSDKGAACDAAT